MSNEQEEIRYSRDRSRSRSREQGEGSDDDYGRDGRNARNYGNEEANNGASENFSLYVSNMSIETTDETLKAAFERFGEVVSATIVREPVTKKSRGFAFITLAKVDASIQALTEMNGAEIEGHVIRVEKAKRKDGYEKTPGQYLGPPQLSSKYRRGDRRDDRDRRGGGGGGSGGGRPGGGDNRDRRDDHRRDSRADSRDRFRERERERERERDPRDLYERYPPYQLPPPNLYDRAPLLREDRYLQELRAELYRRDLRYDPRDIRAPPILAPPLYEIRRSPPRSDYRPRSPIADRRPSDRRRSSSRH